MSFVCNILFLSFCVGAFFALYFGSKCLAGPNVSVKFGGDEPWKPPEERLTKAEKIEYADEMLKGDFHSHEKATQLYLVKLKQGRDEFLKIGISDYSVKKRFGIEIKRGELDCVERVTSIVYTKRQDAYSAEQRLLHATRKYHHKPRRDFGGASECRDLSLEKKLVTAMKKLPSRPRLNRPKQSEALCC